MQAQTKHFLLFPVKLIEYIFSAETVCSNPCVRPLSRIKIYFFLLLIFVDEPISTRKIIAFLSGPPLGEEGGGGVHVYQVQFHIQNTYTYQYQDFYLRYCTKQKIPLCWITADIKIFTYLINNVNVYYF